MVKPEDVISARERLDLTQGQFGEALGLADGARIVRAWEHGERNGKPCAPSGSALAAMKYLEAIDEALDALEEGDQTRAGAILCAAIPECMR